MEKLCCAIESQRFHYRPSFLPDTEVLLEAMSHFKIPLIMTITPDTADEKNKSQCLEYFPQSSVLLFLKHGSHFVAQTSLQLPDFLQLGNRWNCRWVLPCPVYTKAFQVLNCKAHSQVLTQPPMVLVKTHFLLFALTATFNL